MKRQLSFQKQVYRFLEEYEDQLCKAGYSEQEIQNVAAAIIDLIRGLEVCVFRVPPQGVANDDDDETGFTQYKFQDKVFTGAYLCDGNEVILKHLQFSDDVLSVISVDQVSCLRKCI